MPNSMEPGPVAVLGAGPAGLTAAYALARRGRPAITFEASAHLGGLARTVVRDGYRFDLGGHRFFTKSQEVREIWQELLGDELLLRPRLSRIRWRGRFVDYPLSVSDVIRKVGPIELMRCAGSFARARARAPREAESFEDWVVDRFGRRLFELFFRSYTEKVWGVPTSSLRAEWAAQRIRELSFTRAARAAIAGGDAGSRSLTREFLYPRLGPGQMWETMATETVRMGGEVRLRAPVTRLSHRNGRIVAVSAGGQEAMPSDVISSLPLADLPAMMDPAPPVGVARAAGGLRYRDFITVALVVEGDDPFPDNWVYVHDPDVRAGRIQNFRSWSPWLVPHPDRTCVGLEYFCFRGDDLWSATDAELVELASRELERVGLAAADRVERGWVVRVPRAYPIYDSGYAERVRIIRDWLEGFQNLQQVGRNGLHRYNNSDHSMLTAIRAVENVCAGSGHDIWAVNAESAYHEEHGPDEHPYLAAPEQEPSRTTAQSPVSAS